MAKKKAEGDSGDVVIPRDPLDPARESKAAIRGKTGVVYDERFVGSKSRNKEM